MSYFFNALGAIFFGVFLLGFIQSYTDDGWSDHDDIMIVLLLIASGVFFGAGA